MVSVRLLSLILAAGVGYLIGAGRATALREPDVSATAAVGQRFPQDWKTASDESRAVIDTGATTRDADNVKLANAKLALLSPEPMAPPVAAPGAPPPFRPVTLPTATAEAAAPSPAPRGLREQVLRSPTVAQQPLRATKPEAAAVHRRDDGRPGYMLNDKQLANIKERLHLTTDQERMWPAVEAALRRVAYARAQDARGRTVAAGAVEAASVDPNSTEVQGLKTAAVPLIMSFDAEQKEEVRNLVHVMGLDQLATQF